MWDFLGNYGFNVYPIGPLTYAMCLLIVTIAIVKHQLMDIQIAIKEGLVYSFLVSSITLIYVVMVLLFERLFFHSYIPYHAFPGFLATACLIAVICIPLRNMLQRFVDKFFFFKGSTMEIAAENELLRQEMIQTERLKAVSILASGMAHEIKNPLTALKTFSEYLPKKFEDKAFLQKFSPIISHAVSRIDSLVHELLDFPKPAPVQLKPTKIHCLLENTLEFLSNDFIKHKIKVTEDFQASPETLLNLDQNQFKQALLNILLNAVEAMPDGGEITVSTSLWPNQDQAIIKIQDSGIGISPDDLKHIFDPFFTKKDHGTGLGLSITFEIIKNHNGKIFAESKLGSGTTFIIELPYNSPF